MCFKKMPHAAFVVALLGAFLCHFTGVADRITTQQFYQIVSRNLDAYAMEFTYFDSC